MKRLATFAAGLLFVSGSALAQITTRDVIRVIEDDFAPIVDTQCFPTQDRVVRSWRTGAEFYCDDTVSPPQWKSVDSANSACMRGICFADKMSTGGTGTYSDPFVGWETEFIAEFASEFAHLHLPVVGNDRTYYAGSLLVDSALTTGNFSITGGGKDKVIWLNTSGDGTDATKRALTIDLSGVSPADRRSACLVADVGFEQKQNALAAGGSIVAVDNCLRLEFRSVTVAANEGHCFPPEGDLVCSVNADCSPGPCLKNDWVSAGTAIAFNDAINYGNVYDLEINGKDETALFAIGVDVFRDVSGNVGPLNFYNLYVNRAIRGVVVGEDEAGSIINNVNFYGPKILPNGSGFTVPGSVGLSLYGFVRGSIVEGGLFESNDVGILVTDTENADIRNNTFSHFHDDGDSKAIMVTNATPRAGKRVNGLNIAGNYFFGPTKRCSGDQTVYCQTTAECAFGVCSNDSRRACDDSGDCSLGGTCGGTAPTGTCEETDLGQTCIYIDSWHVESAWIKNNEVATGTTFGNCPHVTWEDDTPGVYQCNVTTATSCTDNGDCPGGEYCVFSDFRFRYEHIVEEYPFSVDNDRTTTHIWDNLSVGDGTDAQNPTIWLRSGTHNGKIEMDVANDNGRIEFNKALKSSGGITADGSMSTRIDFSALDDTLLNDVELNMLRMFRGNAHDVTIGASGEINANATELKCSANWTTTCTVDTDCSRCSTTTSTWCDEDTDCPSGETCDQTPGGECETYHVLWKRLTSNAGTADTLEIVNNGSNGDLLILSPAAGHDITIQDTQNGGDVSMYGSLAQDCILDSVGELVLLMRTSTNSWLMLASNGCSYRDTFTSPVVLFRDTGLKTSDDIDDVFKAAQQWIVTGVNCSSDDSASTINLLRHRGASTANLLDSGTCTCNGSCTINTANQVLIIGDSIDYQTLDPQSANRISVNIYMVRRDVD